MSIFKKLPIRWVFIVSGFIGFVSLTFVGLVQQRLEAQGSDLFQAIHGKVAPDDLIVDPYYVKGMDTVQCDTTRLTDETFRVADVSFVMKGIQGGTFVMGDGGTEENEQPAHQVAVGVNNICRRACTSERDCMGNQLVEPALFRKYVTLSC